MKIKKIFRRLLVLLFLGIVFIWGSDTLVQHTAEGQLYDKVNKVPPHKVALVLGTIKTLANGHTNMFFTYRINAAAALYKAGKARHFIVSGDNHTEGYDEPSDMRDALIAKGVPASAITLDYAGFRTLDSIVRAKEVFGQQSFIVVSQPFHNERALFLAQKKGIDAVGFNAQTAAYRYGYKVYLREYLARVKAVLDIYVLRTQPKFLGPKVQI